MAGKQAEKRTVEPGQGKKIIQTAFISAIYFIFGILRSQEGVVFLDLISIVNSDIASGSLMFTVSAVGYVIGVLLIGILFDKFNNDILYCTCAVLVGVATLIIPWCRSLTVMIAIFAVRSFVLGPADSGSSVICTKIWQLKAGPFLQNLQFLFAIGGIISPFITEPFLLQRQSTNSTTQVDEQFPHFFNFTINKTIMSTSQKLFPAKELDVVNLNNTENPFSPLTEDADATTSKVYIAFTIAGGLLLCVCVAFAVKIAIYSSGDFDRFEKSRKSRPEHRRLDPLSNFTMLRKMVCYVLLTVNCFSQGCVEKILMSFLMTFTVKYLGWSKKNGSLAITVFWVGFAGGRFLGIFLIKIIKPQILLLVTLLGLLITFGAMLIVDYISWPEEFWWVLFGASGLFLAPLFASYVSWIDSTLTPVTGKLMSFVYVWLFVGTMTHMALLGYLFEAVTPLWFLYLLIIHTVLLIITFVALCLLSRTHNQQNNTGYLLPAR